MTRARGEIGKRHFVRTAHFRLHLVDLARESIWWKPFGHRARIKERAIYFLRLGAEHSVKSDGIGILCCHVSVWFELRYCDGSMLIASRCRNGSSISPVFRARDVGAILGIIRFGADDGAIAKRSQAF